MNGDEKLLKKIKLLKQKVKASRNGVSSSSSQEANGGELEAMPNASMFSETVVPKLETCNEEELSLKRKAEFEFFQNWKKQKKDRDSRFSLDCLMTICEFLPPRKLFTSIMVVCKDWRNALLNNNFFWFDLYKRIFFEDLNVKKEQVGECDFLLAFKTRYAFVLKHSIGSSLTKFLKKQDSLVERAYRADDINDATNLFSECLGSQAVFTRFFDLQKKQVDFSLRALEFIQEVDDIKNERNILRALLNILLQRTIDLTDDSDEETEANFSRHDLSVLDNVMTQFRRFTKSRNSIIVTNSLYFGREENNALGETHKLDFIIFSTIGHYAEFKATINCNIIDDAYLDGGRLTITGQFLGDEKAEHLMDIIYDGESDRSRCSFHHTFIERCIRELGLQNIAPRVFVYFLLKLISTNIDGQLFYKLLLNICMSYHSNNRTQVIVPLDTEDAVYFAISDEEDEEGDDDYTEEDRRFVVDGSDDDVEELEEDNAEIELDDVSSGSSEAEASPVTDLNEPMAVFSDDEDGVEEVIIELATEEPTEANGDTNTSNVVQLDFDEE
ncbi:hypothetical protein C9374_008660 [Naegleria lovaniensis]|uniref:F-box domain-containing protein n=1 Tax=Naegleria lovaniensis TaxID=51637 RepID=A0AA88GKX4_NAELO|nr:uncharacterized protein C9374_008660 [Naegleria lovaniensis]KAG2378038.1 hypothetical protein C9374_008660 [Naegleria lovaniensis]